MIKAKQSVLSHYVGPTIFFFQCDSPLHLEDFKVSDLTFRTLLEMVETNDAVLCNEDGPEASKIEWKLILPEMKMCLHNCIKIEVHFIESD
ncbi:hypothetical protein D5086_011444 [Populus alba]|uniref:Uncharacterized protein n=1 Tax=Populus alba TaxID=43335 RepID=A0ACC4CD05_POPAL